MRVMLAMLGLMLCADLASAAGPIRRAFRGRNDVDVRVDAGGGVVAVDVDRFGLFGRRADVDVRVFGAPRVRVAPSFFPVGPVLFDPRFDPRFNPRFIARPPAAPARWSFRYWGVTLEQDVAVEFARWILIRRDARSRRRDGPPRKPKD